MIYYAISLALLATFFGISSPNEIEGWEASILLIAYLGYILLMVFNEKIHDRFFYRFEPLVAPELGMRISTPLKSFSVGIIRYIGGSDDISTYVQNLGAIMFRKMVSMVEKIFLKIDTDGNGLIDRGELKKALRLLGVSRKQADFQVDVLMNAADANGDGGLSLTEFSNWYITQQMQ